MRVSLDCLFLFRPSKFEVKLCHGPTLLTMPLRETVDYILFIEADVDFEPNPNEVKDAKYVSPEELKSMFKDSSLKFTPWFKLICETMLFGWWENLEGLEKFENETQIRRM